MYSSAGPSCNASGALRSTAHAGCMIGLKMVHVLKSWAPVRAAGGGACRVVYPLLAAGGGDRDRIRPPPPPVVQQTSDLRHCLMVMMGHSAGPWAGLWACEVCRYVTMLHGGHHGLLMLQMLCSKPNLCFVHGTGGRWFLAIPGIIRTDNRACLIQPAAQRFQQKLRDSAAVRRLMCH